MTKATDSVSRGTEKLRSAKYRQMNLKHLSDSLLSKIQGEFLSSLAIEESLYRGLVALRQLIPADGAFCNTLFPQERQVRFLAHVCDREQVATRTVVSVSEEVIERRLRVRDDVYVVADVSVDSMTATVAPTVAPLIASYLMVRLQLEGQHLGVVCFYSNRKAAFTSEHVQWVRQLALPRLLSLVAGFALTEQFEERNRHLRTQFAVLSEQVRHSYQENSESSEALDALLRVMPSLHSIAPMMHQAARFPMPLLITGAAGTGKEKVARAIHAMSTRAQAPFIRVQCTGIESQHLEAEFFGVEESRFSDVRGRRIGLLEEASGGTVFLDEVSELPMVMQAKLLAALQTQTICRVGGQEKIPINVRFIAASNQNLISAITERRFRHDLYYRLNVLSIHVPPLKERLEDFQTLVPLFIEEVLERCHLLDRHVEISPAVWDACRNAQWPGNIRELKNTIWRSILAIAHQSGVLHFNELLIDEAMNAFAKAILPSTPDLGSESDSSVSDWAGVLRAEKHLPDFETLQSTYFSILLNQCHGRISGPQGAAKIAKMNPNTFRSKLVKLGLLTNEKMND